MTTTGSGAEKHPTARQLAYLKALAEALEDAAAIQGFEIVGYGSNYTWSH
jgi:hypothetical protein